MVRAAVPFVLHFEFQSDYDPTILQRMLRYNALLHEIHEVPVVSVLILLRRKADRPEYTGTYSYGVIDRPTIVTFNYQVFACGKCVVKI